MIVTPVDPRDQTWEIGSPRYRVYFFTGNASDEYEIAGADIDQVLEWIASERGERSFIVYACVPHDGLGLVRLAGADPNDA